MGRRLDKGARSLFLYDAEADRSECKLCGRSLKGNHLTNLLRHITRHKGKLFSESIGKVNLENRSHIFRPNERTSSTNECTFSHTEGTFGHNESIISTKNDAGTIQVSCEPSLEYIENDLSIEIENVKEEADEADSGMSVGAPEYNALQTAPSDENLPMLSFPSKRIRLESSDLAPSGENQPGFITSMVIQRESETSGESSQLATNDTNNPEGHIPKESDTPADSCPARISDNNTQKMFVEVLNVVKEQNLRRHEFENQMLQYQKEVLECNKNLAISLNNIGCGLNSIGNALLQFAQAMKKN